MKTRTPVKLLLSKSFCFLDGKHEFLLQLLVAFIRREIQTVEAKQRNRVILLTFLLLCLHALEAAAE